MWRIDWNSPYTLKNWVTELNLVCLPVNNENEVEIKHDTSYIGSSYFLGMVVSIIIFPRLSEIYGRLKVLYVMIAFGLISMTGILFVTSSVLHLQIYYFINGMAASIGTCVGYNYLMEFIPNERKFKFSTIFFVGSIIPTIMYPFYFMYVSKNWLYF